MPNTLSLFATEVFQKSLGVGVAKLNRELVKECYQIAEVDREGKSWSSKNYPKGYTSYGSMAELFRVSSTFANLKKRIDKQMIAYAHSLEMNIESHKLEMTHLWINIVPEHGYHGMHLHPLSSLSGSYYLQVPANSGEIKFEDPRIASFMGSVPRVSNPHLEHRAYVSLKPKAGDIIAFESWLKHEVTQNQSKRDRISVSFNYNWY